MESAHLAWLSSPALPLASCAFTSHSLSPLETKTTLCASSFLYRFSVLWFKKKVPLPQLPLWLISRCFRIPVWYMYNTHVSKCVCFSLPNPSFIQTRVYGGWRRKYLSYLFYFLLYTPHPLKPKHHSWLLLLLLLMLPSKQQSNLVW